ncbi:MAG: HrpE/YscL family type III secretion apparatus protein [Janthinobacterium lividum]
MFLVNEDRAAEDGAHEAASRYCVPAECRVIPRRTAERILAATRLLDEARRTARQLVTRAADEADALRQQARDAGYAAGHAQGMAAGFAHLCEASDAARAALCNDVAQQAAIVNVIEQALDTVFAEREDAARLRDFVARGLAALHAPPGCIRVVVHPAQADALQPLVATWAERYPALDLTLQADSLLARDSYRIEGGAGDARWCLTDSLPVALAELKRRLRQCP